MKFLQAARVIFAWRADPAHYSGDKARSCEDSGLPSSGYNGRVSASLSVWVRIRRVTVAGNFLGAILTFFYFRFIDQGAASPPIGPWEIAYSVVAFTALATLGYAMSRRWSAPLWAY